MSKIIFFGNQKLVQGYKTDVTAITDALKSAGHEIIASVETQADLKKLPALKSAHPDALAVLASFGYIIPQSIIELFEPIGILNIHPSLLPRYRGSTPIESAILNGDTETGVSIMKIAQKMDSGPLYAQKSLKIDPNDDKFTLAAKLTALGASTLVDILPEISKIAPTPQDESKATYTEKLDKSLQPLTPELKSAITLDREVRAYLGFPKSKLNLLNINCTILKTHVAGEPETPLDKKCADGNYLIIDRLLPENSKEMDAASFLRGYSDHNATKKSPALNTRGIRSQGPKAKT
jgi:methionyl-tRNA formyltransferase